MSVLLETSLGDLVIDLEVEACPELSENFLKVSELSFSFHLLVLLSSSQDLTPLHYLLILSHLSSARSTTTTSTRSSTVSQEGRVVL